MGTPSTATALPHLNHFYAHNSHFPDYNLHGVRYGTVKALAGKYNNYSTNSSPEARHTSTPSLNPKQPSVNASVTYSTKQSPDMPPPKKRKPDWQDFYRNGTPKEVIVIDDSPEPAAPGQQAQQTQQTYGQEQSTIGTRSRHMDKRRKVESSAVEAVRSRASYRVSNQSAAASDVSRRPSTNGHYSTAPTSLGSSSSVGHTARLDETKIGQKRKRAPPSDSDLQHTLARVDQWGEYIPPPRPPVKARDVVVKVVPDKTYNVNPKYDDQDGHYIVMSNHDLTDRYEIVRQLGQGTFGKVVEAIDRKTRTRCAIKIIRAVPKYRDASKIELRVLATLASNDKHNRNRCIHFRECFDFRNHICIVTDLLSESVFDFLKKNSFVPFPSTHIQSFAKQLLTSVAFLHDLNLIHTDLKPENILLVSNSYQTFTYNRAIPSSSRGTARSAKQRRVLFDPEIRLIDFGSATFDDEYHSSVVSTRHYRAPEIILNLGWSFPCDIWSIGCILVEFFTGDALFQTHDNLEHLAMMQAVCGTNIPKEIIDKVRAKDRRGNQNAAATYFRPRAPNLDYPNTDTPRQSKKFVKNMKRLDETIPPVNRFNELFLELLQRIFVYDPRKRITAHEALQHPWFQETLQDDGTEAKRILREKQRRS